MMENEFDLIEIAEWFSSDLKTRNANSIETEVTILKNEKDIQEVEFKEGDKAVSYTHLDVYKRQVYYQYYSCYFTKKISVGHVPDGVWENPL